MIAPKDLEVLFQLDRSPVLKQPIHDRVALHMMAHLPRVL